MDRYGDRLPEVRAENAVEDALEAVVGSQPALRPEDILDALALIRAARTNLEATEAALLSIARHVTEEGKPLLTFRAIAAALGLASEQAAQGRYRRKVAGPTRSPREGTAPDPSFIGASEDGQGGMEWRGTDATTATATAWRP